MFVFGDSGFIKVNDLTLRFQEPVVVVESFPVTAQTLNDVYVWDKQIWIAGDTSLWYTELATFDPATSTFTEIDLDSFVKDENGNTVISKIKKLTSVKGNYFVDSTLQSYIEIL